MSVPFDRVRRFTLCALALSVAGSLFRPQLADALVARGDELLYRNQPVAAEVHYARAVALDPDSGVAADRFVFTAMRQHTPAALARAFGAATAYLKRHPGDPAVLTDRALCDLIAKHYAAASRDFLRAARNAGYRRELLFAAIAERRARERQR